MPTNDNDPSQQEVMPASPDPHGHAALLLVESLIHDLFERAVFSAGEAVEIVERAIDIQREVAEEADGAAAPMWRSHALLVAIANSLSAEDPHGATPPQLVS